MNTSLKQQREELDELLANAKKLKQQSADHSQKSQTAPQRSFWEYFTAILEKLRGTQVLVKSLVQALSWVFRVALHPLWCVFAPVFRKVSRLYLGIWNRWTITTDPKTGKRSTNQKRASMLLLITFIGLSVFTPTKLGDVVRFFTVEPIYDGAMIALTKKTEVFYLNHSEEIDPSGNVHSVRGCKHETQCSELDAVYFRVKPRLAHDAWKLWAYGNPIYVPDHVVAPIAPGVNRCDVTYYGYRMTSSWISRLVRSLQIYPVMLDAQCTYLGGHEALGGSAPEGQGES